VLLVDEQQAFVRLLIGLLISLIFLVGITNVKPFKSIVRNGPELGGEMTLS
jgi:hypothetical protein